MLKKIPTFGPELTQKYSDANQKFKQSDPVKPVGSMASFRRLVALDLIYMVGCDCAWTKKAAADAAQRASDAASDTARPILAAGKPGDDAVPPPPVQPDPFDPMDFVKWYVADMAPIPLSDQNFS